MNNPPKTIEEARAYLYGAINSYYHTNYHFGGCAFEVPVYGWSGKWFCQCTRRNGHGINGLYCKQHAEIVERMIKDE